MWKDIEYEDTKDKKYVWIDVRSEGEFAESRIPEAINVPLFNDSERAQVGTVYKQVGPVEARELGLQIASAKLPQLVQAIQEAAEGGQPVVYCWRGGMRSKSITTILDLMGMEALRLEGGYRAYREYVQRRLTEYHVQPRAVVLHGMTGVGKTEILRSLQSEGVPVLDLEGLAGHKGSAFGSISEHPRNQRMFDSLLLEALDSLQDQAFFLMEAESKRIGRVQMPDFLLNTKEKGLHLLLEAPLEIRVERTLKQYMAGDPEFADKLRRALESIQKAFTPDQREWLQEKTEARHYHELVRFLLVEYYDPRYRHAGQQYVDSYISIDATDLHSAKRAILDHVQQNESI